MTDASDVAEAVQAWMGAFANAVESQDIAGTRALLDPDAYWRDILALTWDLHTFYGVDQIETALRSTLPSAKVTAIRQSDVAAPRRVIRGGRDVIEVLIDFETSSGRGRGVVRLVETGAGPLTAWTVMTALDALTGSEPDARVGELEEVRHTRDFAGPNWRDRRLQDAAYADRDPAVLVVGAGQAGLGVAARLRQLGVDTLVVDRMARVGDNWRTRYHALVLHNEVYANHLPYMPFPDTWPTYIPKDMLADWFEAYAAFMELNVWTGTEFCGGAYDAATQRWRVTVRRADGTDRVMRPRHIIMATGVSGIPYRPQIDGLDSFGGEIFHSSTFTQGAAYGGKHVIVIGTGTSGHDVAQDLASHGAEVTIVQRSPSTVVSVGPDTAGRVYSMYLEGLPTEVTDLINIGTPYPVMRHSYQLLTKHLELADKEMLDGLRSIGFKLDYGEDNTGFQMKYLRKGGGYYLDVGCSDMLISGRIKLLQREDIATFEAGGARLVDGTLRHADAVVLATGYLDQNELIRRLFGNQTAQRVGPIWGFDDEGELRNMWRRTGQTGLWFSAGSLAQCRIFSKYLALQIKACEDGRISTERDANSPRGSLRDRDLVDI